VLIFNIKLGNQKIVANSPDVETKPRINSAQILAQRFLGRGWTGRQWLKYFSFTLLSAFPFSETFLPIPTHGGELLIMNPQSDRLKNWLCKTRCDCGFDRFSSAVSIRIFPAALNLSRQLQHGGL
jgi:hypothetical protein